MGVHAYVILGMVEPYPNIVVYYGTLRGLHNSVRCMYISFLMTLTTLVIYIYHIEILLLVSSQYSCLGNVIWRPCQPRFHVEVSKS